MIAKQSSSEVNDKMLNEISKKQNHDMDPTSNGSSAIIGKSEAV